MANPLQTSTMLSNLVVAGSLTAGSLNLPNGAVSDANVNAAAAIATSKMLHRFRAVHSQPNTTATTETKPVFITYGLTGTLISFKAGSIAPNAGAATVTVDLYKNGTSVLSLPITLNSSNTARVAVAAAFADTATAVGDWFDIVITATAGGGTLATGVYAELIVDETPS